MGRFLHRHEGEILTSIPGLTSVLVIPIDSSLFLPS